tara:strand:- start:1114037 stop:1114447 length:411 start_codon:yes stop_codon:yes gene_type:complete
MAAEDFEILTPHLKSTVKTHSETQGETHQEVLKLQFACELDGHSWASPICYLGGMSTHDKDSRHAVSRPTSADVTKDKTTNNSATIQTTNIERFGGAAGSGVCPVCLGRTLFEIRGKLQCARCHTICETCCEGGRC